MKNVMNTICVLTALIFMTSTVAHAKPSTRNRNEIPVEFKWDLRDMYTDWSQWEKDLLTWQDLMNEYAALHGTIGTGPDFLLKACLLSERIGILETKINYYPGLMRAVDGTDQSLLIRLQKFSNLYTQYAATTSWFTTEFFAIPRETLHEWVARNKELQRFAHEFESLYRARQYILSEENEKLLTLYSPVLNSPGTIYSQLTMADKKYPEITLSTGEKKTLTDGTYVAIMKDPASKSDDRKNTYYAFNMMYKNMENTLAAIYDSITTQHVVTCKTRTYNSVLHLMLHRNNIPESVYVNLVTATRAHTKELHRFLMLKKNLVMKKYNISELMPWDASLPVTEKTKEFSYEEAKKHTLAASAFFGKDYYDAMKHALESGWIDVYENTGKYNGAGTFNVYGVHPYVMLNYNDTQNYMFTLCHEMGHALHSLYSINNQPYSTHNPTIFVAEVASTMNERILLDYLLAHTQDHDTRLALLSQAIANYTNLFFNATMMAEFELLVSRLAENGQPLSADVLTSVAHDLETAYYGDIMHEPNEFRGIFWTKVNHFFTQPFYVYQYATSFAASAKLYKDMTTGSKKSRDFAKERYMELMKSGCNDYPMAQLKKAGVDMNDPDVVQAVIDDFRKLVTLFEKEITKI